MDYKTLRFEEPEPGLALVTMNRPDRLNAINFDALDDFHQLYEFLTYRKDDYRVLLLTGEGRSFCSGADLKDERILGENAVFFSKADIHLENVQKKFATMISELSRLPQTVISAVNGAAAGGGMCIALASDIVIAESNARFIASFANIGLSGGELGTSYLLPRLVGLAKAADILMTGRTVGAEEAERIGMISRVVPKNVLVEEAMNLAAELLTKSPFSLRMTKDALRFNHNAPSLDAAIEFENRNQSMGCCASFFFDAVMSFQSKKKQPSS